MPKVTRSTRTLTAALLIISLTAAVARAADPKPAPSALLPVATSDVVENSVVKIFTTMRYPDLTKTVDETGPA